MRFFAYHGTDSQGRPTQGTIQAPSADEAQNLLRGGGVRTAALRELGTAAVPAARPRIASAAPSVSRPVVAPLAPIQAKAAPVSVAPAPAEQWRFAGNKTSFFFFEALSRYIRSGIAPNRALEELGQRSRKAWLADRLLRASVAVGKGASLADALQDCNCFPTGCVGTVRAGEASGAVPDACLHAADGCERAHKLWIKSTFMLIVIIVAAGFWPLGKSIIDGSLNSMEKQWEASGSLPAGATAWKYMSAELRRNMPVAALAYLLTFVLWRVWLSNPLRMLRHKANLFVPILAGRAKDESLSRASWALTELARAGLPPNRALAFAADACPNLEMARRFRNEAHQMREQDRLSSALRRSGLLNPQLVDVVENGELAGDVPGAIGSVHRSTEADFQRKDGSASAKIYFVLYPLVGILVAVIVGTLYKTLVMGEFRIIQ